MTLIERIKGLFHSRKITHNLESTGKEIETTDVSIIDTSNLEIDRNLTREENESRKKLFEEVSSGNFSTFITYGNDIAKKTNYYMDIIRKRINQNIEENKILSRNTSLEQIIRQKIKIIFNNAEIDSILKDLRNQKRNCELRIIALEDVGNIELKKSKRRIFFMRDKVDSTKINAINNAIARLSAHIRIIDMLCHSVKNERLTYYNENNTLNEFLSKENEEESKKIAKEILNETYEELKTSINAIATFSDIPSLVIDGKTLDKLDIEKMTLEEKVEVVALSKRYLDLYVAENRKKLLSTGGLLDRAKEYQNKLWEEIESDYLDVPLWAKKVLDYLDTGTWETIQEKNRLYYRYHSRIEIFEKLNLVFGEEIPEDFKERFYKIKFYYYALYNETNNNDSFKDKPFEIKSEEEKNYYLKFITEIVDKIHRESNDGELLNFMDKYLSLKNPDEILEHYNKLTTLLRIEKFERDGLFTLMFYLHDNFDLPICLDQIYTDNLENLKIMPDNNSYKMAKDVLKMWKSTTNLEKMYNGFFGDYNDGWKLVKRLNDGLYPRSNPGIYKMNFQSEYIEFLVQTIRQYNKFARKANIALENKFCLNPEFNVKMHIGQYIAMFSYLIEKMTGKGILKESVLAKICSDIDEENDEKNNGNNVNLDSIGVFDYNKFLEKILPDLKEYMHNNLSKRDSKILYQMMSEDCKGCTLNSGKELRSICFQDDKIDEKFDFDKYKHYKSIIDICKSFYKLGIDGWTVTFMCLKLDKDFGMENVRDELLTNYHINQTIDKFYQYEDYTLNMYNIVNGLRCCCSDRVYEKDDMTLESFNDCIEFFILNRLTDKDVLKNEEDFRIASYIAHYYRKVIERLWRLQINIR